MNKNKVEEILVAMSNNYAASVNSESAMADNAAELLSMMEGVDGHDQTSIAEMIACRQWSDWHNGQNEAYASNEKFSWTKLCRALSAGGWFYSTARKGLSKAYENVTNGDKFKSSLIQSVVFPPAQNDKRKRTDKPTDGRSMDWKKAEKKISDLTASLVKVKAPKRGKEYESAKASMILAAAKLGLKVG